MQDDSLKLYLIARPDAEYDWDRFIDAVVAARSEDEARVIHPGLGWDSQPIRSSEWVPPEQVTVTYIGIAAPNIQPNTVVHTHYKYA